MRFEMIDDDSGKMMPVPSNDAERAFLHANPEFSAPVDHARTMRIVSICAGWLRVNGGPGAVSRRWVNKEDIDGPWKTAPYVEERTRRKQEKAECKKEKLRRYVKELRNLSRNLLSDPDYVNGRGRQAESGAVSTLVAHCTKLMGTDFPPELNNAPWNQRAQVALDWIPPFL